MNLATTISGLATGVAARLTMAGAMPLAAGSRVALRDALLALALPVLAAGAIHALTGLRLPRGRLLASGLVGLIAGTAVAALTPGADAEVLVAVAASWTAPGVAPDWVTVLTHWQAAVVADSAAAEAATRAVWTGLAAGWVVGLVGPRLARTGGR